MTYQPERDGYSVANTRRDDEPIMATRDDRPVVVDDDGTRTTVDDMRAEELRAQEARTVRTDGMGTPIESPSTVTDARIARDNAIVEGRHARDLDAEDAHAVVADDPRAVRGRRVETVAATPVDSATLVARERAAYGGIKWGSAFFGWLTAMGLAVVLTALLAAAGTALGVANDVTSTDAVGDAVSGNASTIGIAGAIAVLLVMLVSYFAGGYVAARMARLDGARQGFAVWLWSIAIAAVLGIIAVVVGDQYDVLGNLNTFPRVPVDMTAISTVGAIALVLAVIVSLMGAVLGGMAGMNYHRRLDAAALDPTMREVVR